MKNVSSVKICRLAAIVMMMIITLMINCRTIDNRKLLTVIGVDAGLFVEHHSITLKSPGGDCLLLVSKIIKDTSPMSNNPNWLDMEVGMLLSLDLVEFDSLTKADFAVYLLGYDVGYVIDCSDSLTEESNTIPVGTQNVPPKDEIVVWADGKIQCKVYRSDDIVGTFVRKSAVVNK